MMKLRIRAYRAPDDRGTNEQFAIGHKKVLEILGVKVTSDNREWFDDPYVYVIVAEDVVSNKVVGGVRLHIANDFTILPMVEAIGHVDPKIYTEVDRLKPRGTAEIAGIWNSREVMGMGLGAIYLMRAVVAIASQLKLGSIMSLASKATLQRGYDKGFEPMTSVGRNGEFNYPKFNLVATVVICRDHFNMPLANEVEKTEINKMRKLMNFETQVEWPRGQFMLEYQLQLKYQHYNILH